MCRIILVDRVEWSSDRDKQESNTENDRGNLILEGKRSSAQRIVRSESHQVEGLSRQIIVQAEDCPVKGYFACSWRLIDWQAWFQLERRIASSDKVEGVRDWNREAVELRSGSGGGQGPNGLIVKLKTLILGTHTSLLL